MPYNNACNSQSKKRGLSLEEKRDKVLEIFHETKDVFQLKVQHYSPYGEPVGGHTWKTFGL